MDFVLDLLWRLWRALLVLTGELLPPIVVNVPPSAPTAKPEAASSYLPLVAALIAAAAALFVYFAKARADERNERRKLLVDEMDARMVALSRLVVALRVYAAKSREYHIADSVLDMMVESDGISAQRTKEALTLANDAREELRRLSEPTILAAEEYGLIPLGLAPRQGGRFPLGGIVAPYLDAMAEQAKGEAEEPDRLREMSDDLVWEIWTLHRIEYERKMALIHRIRAPRFLGRMRIVTEEKFVGNYQAQFDKTSATGAPFRATE